MEVKDNMGEKFHLALGEIKIKRNRITESTSEQFA